MLEAVLTDFGVKGRITAVRPGPVVTLYEFEPAAGVKSSRVISLSDDVARSMSAVAARIATISGRNVIGIELPNQFRETVYLREMFASSDYDKARAPLTLALGKTIGGEPVMADLAKMPHLLVAGTTGSGKSVGLNTMILSLLYRMSPQQCRLIMIDPKMLELSVYDGIPHLLSPVVTDPRKAVVALKWAVREMEDRYRKMSKMGVRGVEAFNERVKKAKDKGEVLKRTVQTGFDAATGKPVYEDENLEFEAMPYIVVVVDEVADLMMISGKEIEGAVQRLAQMARAAGIHLIAATQRPSVDVITGTIKANFPTRISFQVTSKIDSRTILGEQGAEQLLGQGDMLYMAAGGRIRRVHGPFVSDHEVEDVVRFLKSQGQPEYLDAVTEEPDEESDDPYALMGGGGNSQTGDDLYDKALAVVARDKKASTSYIQRRLQIGYNRAASLIERMEQDGVVSSRPTIKGFVRFFSRTTTTARPAPQNRVKPPRRLAKGLGNLHVLYRQVTGRRRGRDRAGAVFLALWRLCLGSTAAAAGGAGGTVCRGQQPAAGGFFQSLFLGHGAGGGLAAVRPSDLRAHDGAARHHRDRRHQPSLCREIRPDRHAHPTRSPCPISRA